MKGYKTVGVLRTNKSSAKFKNATNQRNDKFLYRRGQKVTGTGQKIK